MDKFDFEISEEVWQKFLTDPTFAKPIHHLRRGVADGNCMHLGCKECHGTGTKNNGTLCVHMMNSTHKVEVVPIVLEKHPNADSLSIVNVFGGYTCIVRTADWQGVTAGAYLPPDSVVNTLRPEFAFLAPKAKTNRTYRVKAIKLRKVASFGFLVPAPAGSNLGDDVAELLGVTHYEPPIPDVGVLQVCRCNLPGERLMTRQDLTDELWREYDFAGRVYWIENPVALFVGNTTHRVLDNKGVVHCVPGPNNPVGCVLRWAPKDPSKPVTF